MAGLAHRLQVSVAIGAFLVGIALSGPIAEKSRRLLAPLRDLFAATFFFFFGLQIDPKTLPGVMLLAVVVGLISALTKVLTGYWAAGRAGVDHRSRIRAGMALVARAVFDCDRRFGRERGAPIGAARGRLRAVPGCPWTRSRSFREVTQHSSTRRRPALGRGQANFLRELAAVFSVANGSGTSCYRRKCPFSPRSD